MLKGNVKVKGQVPFSCSLQGMHCLDARSPERASLSLMSIHNVAYLFKRITLFAVIICRDKNIIKNTMKFFRNYAIRVPGNLNLSTNFGSEHFVCQRDAQRRAGCHTCQTQVQTFINTVRYHLGSHSVSQNRKYRKWEPYN